MADKQDDKAKKHYKPSLLARIVKVYVERLIRWLVEQGLSPKSVENIIAQLSEETVAKIAEGSTTLGGILHLDRSWFPDGDTGETLYHYANDFLDEFGKEIGNVLKEKKKKLSEGSAGEIYDSVQKRLAEKYLGKIVKTAAPKKRVSPAEIIAALRKEDPKAYAELQSRLNGLSQAKYRQVMKGFYHLDSVAELQGILALPENRFLLSFALLEERSLAGATKRFAEDVGEMVKFFETKAARFEKGAKKLLETKVSDERLQKLRQEQAKLEAERKKLKSPRRFFKFWEL